MKDSVGFGKEEMKTTYFHLDSGAISRGRERKKVDTAFMEY